MELGSGINVLYGENESGKTTTHTFIKSMFYGTQRLRGRAAKNDAYTKYEPWENPAEYGGILWFESKGKNYRLTRNFYKEKPFGELLGEDDGVLLDAEKGGLDGILGGVSEAVYDNTVSVAQLKSVTGADLARELQNYMASYQGTGDSSLDLGRAEQMMKMSRKGYQVQKEKRQRETEKEQEKLNARLEFLSREMEELRDKQSRVEEKEETLQMRPGDNSGGEIIDGRMKSVRAKITAMVSAAVIALLVGVVAVFSRSMFSDKFSRLGLDLCAVLALGVLIYCFTIRGKLLREFSRQKKMKARWLAQQEKLKWNKETLSEAYEEKKADFANLQAEYREYETNSYLPAAEDTEIQAINLAMETIAALSENIHRQVGHRLRERTSQILREITDGRYQEVLLDTELHITVNTAERAIPAERLSRGTIEQIYFALRMSAADLLWGDETFPIILDDVFGMYDEARLAAVLHWLDKEKKQVIISTCNKREMEILEREGIPFRKICL